MVRTPDRAALVTVLSPKMVYSMTEWPRMRAAAVDDGFEVVAWRSAAVSGPEWRDAVAKAGWPRSEDVNVSETPTACEDWLGRPNHFPYSVVIERGRVHSSPIWGVLPDAAWVESLRLRRVDQVTSDKGERR
jgi:hypothetical protein